MAKGAIRRGNLILYPNWKLGDDLRRTGILDDELRRLTDEAALGAKEVAVKVAFDTGDYFSGIRGELGRNRRGLRVGLIVGHDWKSHLVEKGWTTRTGTVIKGKNVLRRGARKTGLRVRAPRKRG